MQKLILISLILWGVTAQIISGQGGESCTEAVIASQGLNISDNSAGDQWYSYTATMDGKITISSVGMTSANTYVEIYDGCDMDAFTFSDDFIGEQSEVSFEVINGLTYYINWRNYFTNQEFEWTLEESAVAQGEFCSFPLASIAGYMVSNAPQNKYRWFEFTASRDGKVTLRAVSENADSCRVAVFDDCSYTSSINNDQSWNPSKMAFDAVEGETYIISWQNGAENGEIEWTIEESNWEVGERCIDPVDIDVSEENSIDHESATNKWYRFIARQDGDLTITSAGLTSEDTYLEVYTGCGEQRAYYSDDADGLQSELTLDVEAGKAYLIKWDKIFTPEAYSFSLKSSQLTTDLTDVEKNDLVIYPNPTEGLVNIDLTSFDSKTVQVKVVSLSGAIVNIFELNAGMVDQFDVSDLRSGIYQIVVEDLVSRKVVRLVKQ